ncbi:MAG: penicillin-binding protein 2 [Alphaproteobacteria bacterium]|nr:penicillin-binding protein 2 [Alphaproteobacteria bacterium]
MATKDDLSRERLFTRRALLLGAGQAGLLSVLAGRIYYLQVVESSRFQTMAEENRVSMRLLPPARGRVLDRGGEALAVNRQNVRVLLNAEQAPNADAVLAALSEIIPIGEADRRRVLRELKRRRSFVPVAVRENLSWHEVSRIEINAPDLPGISIDMGQTRYYPFGPTAAHLVGYVAAVAESELTGDPLLELPGFRIGKGGVEKIHDVALRGRAGRSRVEVNAVGRVVRELDRQDGTPGGDLSLTIDMTLQDFATKRLAGQSGAAAVMDVHSGEVLALASVPAFDPNLFTSGISARDWDELLHNEYTPLINKAVAGQYPPGSTFKPVVALAALSAGLVTPEFRVSCPGHYDLGDSRFHCYKKGGHGSVNLHEAIAQSCDVYFYELARRCGIDRIAAMGRALGLGDRTGLDLPGERGGLMPTRDWKLRTSGVSWQQGETLVCGIGQGSVLATPLQLALMTSRIVNGGIAVQPRLTRELVARDGGFVARPPEAQSIGVKREALELVIKGMEAVTNTQRGTAYAARIKEPEMAMGGKSGTSQVRRITMSERDAGLHKLKDRPWRERDHALFIGFAPVSAPRYAAAVIVEHGGGGSAMAAPVVRDLLIETQKRDPSRRQPPGAPSVASLERS